MRFFSKIPQIPPERTRAVHPGPFIPPGMAIPGVTGSVTVHSYRLKSVTVHSYRPADDTRALENAPRLDVQLQGGGCGCKEGGGAFNLVPGALRDPTEGGFRHTIKMMRKLVAHF